VLIHPVEERHPPAGVDVLARQEIRDAAARVLRAELARDVLEPHRKEQRVPLDRRALS
jgi:hypothetical protein